MNFEQVKGIAERWLAGLIVSALTAAIATGRVPFLKTDDVPVIAAGVAALGVALALGLLGYVQNRYSSLARATVAVKPETVILADPKTAAKTPEPQIISRESNPTEIIRTINAAEEIARKD